jgi:ABC-type phosphate transport system permease subunit
MVGAMAAAVILAMLPLIFILLNLILKGASSLNWAFFVEMPAPAGQSGGGVGHAIVGTLIIVGVACLIGLPIGIGAGVYSAEYPANRLAWISRFTADVMNGTPSIVVGVFAWALIVANQKHFSALAGSVALALLLIPMVMRTTEEMVKLSSAPHSRASSPGASSASPGSRAKPRPCCSQPSAASSSPPIRTSQWPRFPWWCSPTPRDRTRSGTGSPGPRHWYSSWWCSC